MLFVILFRSDISAALAPDFQIYGLLPPSQAVIAVSGVSHVFNVGKLGPKAVLLRSVDNKKAVIEWQGQLFERNLSQQIASRYSKPGTGKYMKEPAAHIKHSAGGYLAAGKINGISVDFLVDTGASLVSISREEADRLKLDWRNGELRIAKTAGGDIPCRKVKLASVTVGDVVINNVEASVLVAPPIGHVLLGMSFLGQTEMSDKDGVLVLRKKH